jgi:hypothetical protein
MKIITLDNKEYIVKYMQSKETISFELKTGVYDYPDFVGSKLYHNSTSSDKYSLTFYIHKTLLVGFKESLKKIVTNESDAIENATYGKLTHIVIEHPSFGAITGNILGEVKCNTGSEADILCSCVFQEHTVDSPIEKKDIQDENIEALNAIDTETTANFDVDLSTQDKSLLGKFAENLSLLYENIQNSAVISAFNDLNTELNAAILDSMRVMNAFKKIISLPNEVIPDTRGKLNLLQSQAAAIMAIPATSYNITTFNANVLSYNMGISSRTAFVSESALQAAAGIKTVPLS